MNRYSEIKQIVDSLEEDFGKFYEKDNKAAGTRIRKGMQELKNLTTVIRKEVQAIKNEATAETKATASKETKVETKAEVKTEEKKSTTKKKK